MLCELCKKNPAAFSHRLPNTNRNAMVCPACLAKISASGMSGFGNLHALNDLDTFDDFIDFFAEHTRKSIDNIVCSNCGFEFNNYYETGKLGCSKCYDVFKKEITPAVQKIHGTTKPNGSRPNSGGAL